MTQPRKGKHKHDMCAPRGGHLGSRLGGTEEQKTLRRFLHDPGDFVPLNREASPPGGHGEL